jgi:hypothetical protein
LIGQAMSDKAVGSGKVTAADVAQHGVRRPARRGSFYVYSHPKALGARHRAAAQGGAAGSLKAGLNRIPERNEPPALANPAYGAIKLIVTRGQRET